VWRNVRKLMMGLKEKSRLPYKQRSQVRVLHCPPFFVLFFNWMRRSPITRESKLPKIVST
jgi:hypothetical protein